MTKANDIENLCIKHKVSLNRVLDHFNLHRMLSHEELNEWLMQGDNYERTKRYIETLN